MNPALRLFALLLLALLLAGCRLTVGVTVEVNRDGGGTIGVALRQDAELATMAEQAGVDPLARMAERIEVLDGWRVAEDQGGADGERVVRISAGFATPQQFDGRWQDLTGALDAPEGRLLGPLAITVDEEADTIAVGGSVAVLVSEVAAADVGTDLSGLTEQLQDAVAVTLSVRTPDTPVQANGQVRFDEGTTEGPAWVDWVAVPGSELPVSVVAERGGPDWLGIVLRVGVALLALLLVVGGVLAQRRR